MYVEQEGNIRDNAWIEIISGGVIAMLGVDIYNIDTKTKESKVGKRQWAWEVHKARNVLSSTSANEWNPTLTIRREPGELCVLVVRYWRIRSRCRVIRRGRVHIHLTQNFLRAKARAVTTS